MRAAILTIVALGFATYGLHLSRTELSPPDEPRYALVAREMVDTGQWLLPRLDGAAYGQKPPLFFWAIAAVAEATGGVDERSARLPSVLSAVGLLLVTFAAARRLFPDPATGVRVGWVAAAVLGTCVRVLVLASRANLDMLHAFWTTTAFLCFLSAVPPGREADPRATRLCLIGFAFAGLAVLTKGVGGLLVPLCLGAWALAGGLRRGARFGFPWLRGAGVEALVAALWVLPAMLVGDAAYRESILFQQTVGRAAVPTVHLRHLYFYFQTLPLNLLPWTIFVPAVGWFVARALRAKPAASPDPSAVGTSPGAERVGAGRGDGSVAAGEDRAGLLFCLVVFSTMFLFFTALPSKRDYYLLPALPWAALLLAWGLDRGLRLHDYGLRLSCWVLVGVMGVAGSACLAWGWIPADARPAWASGDWPTEVSASLPAPALLLGLAGVSAAVAAGWLLGRRRLWTAGVAAVLGLALAWVIYRTEVRPAWNVVESGKAFAERLRGRTADGGLILGWGPVEDALPFHARRAIRWFAPSELSYLVARLSQAPACYLVTTEAGRAQVLRASTSLHLTTLETGWAGGERWVLMTTES